MAHKPYRKIRVTDFNLNSLQDNVAATIAPLLKVPITDGVLITDIDLTTTATKIAHKLGRIPLGWLVVDNTANAVVYRDGDFTETSIPLRASATTNITLWIF